MTRQHEFHFTITDLGLFLDKSPVTLRGWERQGLVEFPRNEKGDRVFDLDGILIAANIAYERKRIRLSRYQFILACVAIMKALEQGGVTLGPKST